MPDHVHMLVSIPPRMSVASFMGYLKGKSALMMFDKYANLKYKFGNSDQTTRQTGSYDFRGRFAFADEMIAVTPSSGVTVFSTWTSRSGVFLFKFTLILQAWEELLKSP